MSWHIVTYYINLIKAIIRPEMVSQLCRESPAVALSYHVIFAVNLFHATDLF